MREAESDRNVWPRQPRVPRHTCSTHRAVSKEGVSVDLAASFSHRGSGSVAVASAGGAVSTVQ